MQQLELKHIAPYLPYELKALQLDYKKNGNGSKCGVLVGFYPLYENKKPVWHYTFDNNATGQTAKAIKPLLRPMSDLFENIVHNGNFFCVAKVICDKNVFLRVEQHKGDYFIWNDATDEELDFTFSPQDLPHWITGILNEYHFDWRHDLIVQGLAEPIKNKGNEN